MFTATGQDIACVHESSIGQLVMEANNEGLYASMDLPALIVGSVGGGTNLPCQRDYLDLIYKEVSLALFIDNSDVNYQQSALSILSELI